MRKYGLLAFTLSAMLGLSASASAQTGYVATDLLNVRTAPSTGSEVTEILQWGDAVTITYGPTMGWYEIYRNGGCYYVSADYVSSDGGSQSYSSDSYSYAQEDSSWSDTADTSYYDSYTDAGSYTDTGYEETSSWEDTSSSGSNGTYLGNFMITAYCGCGICTGGSGVTASGTRPVAWHTAAMGGVPFGTQLLINGTVYTVEDRGTSYGHVDLYFDSHQDAVNFGLQYADVYQVN